MGFSKYYFNKKFLDGVKVRKNYARCNVIWPYLCTFTLVHTDAHVQIQSRSTFFGCSLFNVYCFYGLICFVAIIGLKGHT